MQAKASHPTKQALAAFGLGKLAGDELASVEQHVSACDSCCATLRQVLDDTLVALARDAVVAEPAPAAATVSDETIVHGGPPELSDHQRYRLLGLLGEGGMGSVYKAEHRFMERLVALKVIQRRFTANPMAVERFHREVKAAAKLTHPNIVHAYDADQAGDVHFLVMEYVAGKSLAALVKERGPLPVAQASRFALQAAQGLQYAHELGMVHRDIKPHNLMVTQTGQVKILDFGLARWADDNEEMNPRLTAVDTVVGTPDFLPPEQARNPRNVDIRADIYALGCTLYYALAARPPFPEGNAVEKMFQHLENDPEPLEKERPDLPRALADVVRKMMARRAEDRYATPGEVAAALKPFTVRAPAKPAPARPAPAPSAPARPAAAPERTTPRRDPAKGNVPGRRAAPPKPRPSGRGAQRPLLVAGALAASVLVVLVGWWGFQRIFSSPEPSVQGPAVAGLAPSPQARRPLHVLYVVPPRGLWYPDFGPVRDLLVASGVKVTVASSQAGHAQALGPGAKAEPIDVVLGDDVKAEDYDAIIFAGMNPRDFIDDGRAAPHVARLIEAMKKADRPVAAICTGQLILAKAGALQDHSAAFNEKVHKAHPDHGAIWDYQRRVVADRKVITGAMPEDAQEFARKILEHLPKR